MLYCAAILVFEKICSKPLNEVTSTVSYIALSAALDVLAITMQKANLWPEQVPTKEALQSSEPFAIDTMPFESWLAFIFIPKMRMIVDEKMPIPPMNIAPAAEVYLHLTNEDSAGKDVVEQLQRIDAIAKQYQVTFKNSDGKYS